jgi:hypothetical protein
MVTQYIQNDLLEGAVVGAKKMTSHTLPVRLRAAPATPSGAARTDRVAELDAVKGGGVLNAGSLPS